MEAEKLERNPCTHMYLPFFHLQLMEIHKIWNRMESFLPLRLKERKLYRAHSITESFFQKRRNRFIVKLFKLDLNILLLYDLFISI